MTGVGGGVIRDVLVNDIPLVIRSEIYAISSITGAIVFYSLNGYIQPSLNAYACALLVMVLRLVTVYFNINLPVIAFRKSG